MALTSQTISHLLEATLDPTRNKEAESSLKQAERTPKFSLALLQLVADTTCPPQTRLASALCFKNFIRRNWTDEDGNYKLPEDEVAAIKREIIGLMISIPPNVQSQLGEAVSVIAESDFWERWDTLVDDLVSRLTTDNAAVNNGVLQVAHSIFKRWRPLFQSDGLFTEINHVLSKFSTPFLAVLENTDKAIMQSSTDTPALIVHVSTFNLCLKLFIDLSCQDLPPVFEENMQAVSGLLHKYLIYDNAALHTSDESQAGPIEYLKAGILESVILYAQKYEDTFDPFLPQFITSSWTLLTHFGPATKYDVVVSRVLQFLTAIVRIPKHAESFNNAELLKEVIEQVVLPNLSLRESDLELFEDEPIEFVRRDLEGSDSETRRRAATDFLRQLIEKYEHLVTSVVSKYIDHYLEEYKKDPLKNWKSKDTAVFLFTSIAAKGTSTTTHGIKSINQFTDVAEFFQKNISEDLVAENSQPILTVDAIRYLHSFRSCLSKQHWHTAFPLLVRHLLSNDCVVYTYAAITIERALALTDDSQKHVIPQDEVIKISKDILQRLFSLMMRETAPEKVQENEFLVKCAMRVLISIKENVLPFADIVVMSFINITKIIQANPSNPRFYYYHFEGMGALIRFAAPARPEKLEAALYDPFAEILQSEVQEFLPYVFQLLAALLEANPSASLSEYYRSLIPPLIMPQLWESRGNIPALVRLLSAMMPRGATDMVEKKQLEPILGIFQKLVSSKSNETYAFDLLETIITSFPHESLVGYFVPMLQIILTRLTSTKTESLALRFVRFYHLLSARDDKGLGADVFVQLTDQVQHDIYRPLYTTIILPDTQKLTRPLDRKIAVVSLTKTLADSEAFVERYHKGWALTCEALLKLLINPPLLSAVNDIILDHDVDDLSFGIGFTQLNTCKKTANDPFPEIVDVKEWAGKYLKAANDRHQGRISTYVDTRLSQEARSTLVAYMQ